MNTFRTKPPGIVSKLGAIALSALALAWLPQAEANTSEGATIENIATVSWEDSDGNPDSTTAYVQVTVSLATNAALLSGRPTGVNPGDSAARPSGTTVLSGATANYLYAITATANGSDVYDLSGIQTDATAGVGAPTISWQLKAANGTTDVGGADPATVTLGAAVVAATPGAADTLSFPGGSLSGFAVGDIVVIGNIDYEISAITSGTAPNHGTTTSETLATMTFIANAAGSNIAPSFLPAGSNPVAIGDVVGEQQLLQVSVTATITAPPTAGTVNHDVVVDTSTGGQTVEEQDVTTTFNPAPVITVTKYVRNVLNAAGNAGGIGATVINTVTYYTSGVTGNPGDTLEYVIAVNNANGATQADNVVITDPVPAYTTYVASSMRVDPDGTGWDPAINDGANDAADPGEFDATAGANGTVYIYAGTGGDDGTTAATYNDGTGGSLPGNTTTYGLFQVTIN